jgi:protein gp37
VFEEWQGPFLNSQGHQLFWSHSRHPSESKWHWIGEPETAGGEHPVTMNDVRDRLFAMIDATPNLDWLLLTKRPDNVSLMWPIHPSGRHQEGMSFSESHRRDNVWLGTSIENQEWANKRLPYLHAVKRHGLVNTTFVSVEPLVGHVTLQGDVGGQVYNHLGEGGIDWVISGGESGPDARPADPAWFRSLRDQCSTAGVPFHFKQWGEFDERQVRVGKKNAGRLLDGVTHDGLPVVSVV